MAVLKYINGGSWVTVPPSSAKVKQNGVWKDIGSIKYIDGTWKDSGYIGTPDPPLNVQGASGWQTIYGTFTVQWTAPTTGPTPTSYNVYLAYANDTLVSGSPHSTTSLSYTLTVSDSTQYKVYVKSVIGTVESVSSTVLRIQMGYDTYQDGYTYQPLANDTSTYVRPSLHGTSALQKTSSFSTYTASKAVDSDSTTFWYSASRSLPGQYNYWKSATVNGWFEGLTLQIPTLYGTTDARLTRIRIKVPTNQWVYIGIYDTSTNSWRVNQKGYLTYSGNSVPMTATNLYIAPPENSPNYWPVSNSDDHYTDILYHDYLMRRATGSTTFNSWVPTQDWVELKVDDFLNNYSNPANAISTQNISKICIACTQMVHNSSSDTGYHAAVSDVLVYYNTKDYPNMIPAVTNTTW